MNIAVIGKSKANEILKEQLINAGFVAVAIENIKDIKSVAGAKGDYRINTLQGSIPAGYIVVTEEAATGSSVNGNLPETIPSISLMSAGKANVFDNNGSPIVILLDFPGESPSVMTRIALQKAINLAKKKKKVIYIAGFMRTGGEGLEQLFKEARSLGVVFIRHSGKDGGIDLKYDNDQRMFNTKVFDGYETISIDTGILISADRIVPGEMIARLSKVLRLKIDDRGFLNGDNHFLYPVFTSRKGVYVLNCMPGLSGQDDLQFQIRSAVLAIKKELSGLKDNKYAEVDAVKCAFCYTCYRACPHAAMEPDLENSAMKNSKEGCYGCGICAGVCPADAISIMTDESKEEAVKTCESNEAGAGDGAADGYAGTLKIFCCENSAEIALKKIAGESDGTSRKIDAAPISCGGEVDVEGLISALKQYDRVLVAVCVDDACRHFDGNRRACLETARVKELLKASGMDMDRVECIKVSHAMPYMLRDKIRYKGNFGVKSHISVKFQ